MEAQPAELLTKSLQALKQRAHQLLESQWSLKQQNQALAADCLGFQSECNQLATQHQELSAELDALQAERDNLQHERDSLQIELNQLSAQQQTLETARNTLEQVLHLAHSKQEGRATGNEACRNCGSHRVITIDRAGQVSPFFAARVFGLKSTSPADLFLDAHLCIDCLFLTHAAKLPEESIAKLYEDYRETSYNSERIALEPGYSLIAEQIGKPDEMRRRTADLDEYIEVLANKDTFMPGNIGSALDWGGSTGDYMPTTITKTCRDVHIFDITHSETSRSDICRGPNQLIRTNNASQGKIYDYIQFCHVLEHLQEPLVTVQQIAKRNLKEGGYIYIEVPVEEIMSEFALSLMLTPETSYVVHEHINKYCLRSIKALVESTECLSVLDLREDTTNVGWALPRFNDDGNVRIIRCLTQKRRD